MKRQFSSLIILFLMFSSLAGSVALAQSGSGGGCCWGMGNQSQQMYDPATVETIRGEVVSRNTITPTGRMSGGIHLQVRTQGGETITVHLGPAWYLDDQPIQVELNDTIEVRGSRITFNEQPILIAAEVRKGDQVLTLRDDAGIPVWAGWGRWR